MLDGIDIEVLLWVVVAVLSGVGEIASGAMVLLPFAIAAVVAGILAALGVEMVWALTVFAVISVATLIVLRKLAIQQSLDTAPVRAGGGQRYVDAVGVVTSDIPVAGAGRVRVETESWRAIEQDGEGLVAGTRIRVVEVRGNALIVRPDQASLEAGEPASQANDS